MGMAVPVLDELDFLAADFHVGAQWPGTRPIHRCCASPCGYQLNRESSQERHEQSS
jgi:hypothetical protein